MVVSGQGNETSNVEVPEGSTGSSVQDELESGGKSWRQGSVSYQVIPEEAQDQGSRTLKFPKDFVVKITSCLDRRNVI